MPNKFRILILLFCVAGAVVVTWGPLSDLVLNGRPAEYYSHIPLVPVVSAYILLKRKSTLFRGEPGSPQSGIAAVVTGLGLFVFDEVRRPALIGHAELAVLGAILVLSGSFIALFGKRSFIRALFPFLFLTFMIPLPIAWMDHVVSALVTGSTWITQLLLGAVGVPFAREGSVFGLPGFDLEVARECSGIRSSLALIITGVLAGQIFLRRRWKKIVLAVAVLPVTILKNAIRIVTLYLLSYYVDIRIIEGGFLHKSGGIIFFGLGLGMLAFVLWVLRSPREAWEKVMGEPLSKRKGLTNG